MSDIKTDHAAEAFARINAELAVDRRVFASVTEELRRDINAVRREMAHNFFWVLTPVYLILLNVFALILAHWDRTGCQAP